MRRFRKLLRWAAVLLGLGLLLIVAVALTTRTAWFRGKVRTRIVAEIEESSGGRAEIGAFRFNWRSLEVEARDFTLHGTEPANTPPLFHADSIKIGLRIISFLERSVDIASLEVERPRLHVTVAKDGTTNLPTPKAVRNGDLMARILDLAVRRFEIRGGLIEYASAAIPLDLSGENLRTKFAYEAKGPRYRGSLSLRQLRMSAGNLSPPPVDLDSRLIVAKDKLEITSARIGLKQSSVELAGSFDGLTPARGSLAIKGNLYPAELAVPLKLPISARGSLGIDGKMTFGVEPAYILKAQVTGRGIGFETKDVKVDDATLQAAMQWTPGQVTFDAVKVRALGGTFAGTADIREGNRFKIDGTVKDLRLSRLSRLSGSVSGPVRVEGAFAKSGIADVTAEAKIELAPAEGETPVHGALNISYDQRARSITFGDSSVTKGSSRIQLSGTLGQTLQVSFDSGNLQDFLPELSLAGESAIDKLPIVLKSGGRARFEGMVRGDMSDPQISGQITLTNFVIDDQNIDRLSAAVTLSKSQIQLRNASLDQGELRAAGSGAIGLAQWRTSDESTLAAVVTFHDAPLERVSKTGNGNPAASGTASGSLEIAGTLGAPNGKFKIAATGVKAYDEQFDRVAAEGRFSSGRLEVSSGNLEAGDVKITLKGAFEHPSSDWKNGKLRFEGSSDSVRIARFQAVRKYRAGLDAIARIKVGGSGEIVHGEFRLATLNGDLDLHSVSLDGRSYGDLAVNAATRGEMLELRASADLRGSKISGNGAWRLRGDYPGQGTLEMSHLSLETLNVLRAQNENDVQPLPFAGFIAGDATVSGPLLKPEDLRATVRITTFEMRSIAATRAQGTPSAEDLVLRNAAPIQMTASNQGLTVEKAQLVAKDTKLEVGGTAPFDPKGSMNVQINGSINLQILRLLNSDLLATGVSTVNATIRGSPDDPQVSGRLELKDASLYLVDLPNGVDRANGVILFDQNRANIQTLTAETGGGKLSLAGFVGLQRDALVYHLQGQADNVRIRYPEGASFAANAQLSLTGTSRSSLVSGSVTVIRAGLNPHTDAGDLIAAAAAPTSATVTPNEYVRGMHMDVRIETAPNMEFTSSASRDLQADADLRLRGTPDKPVLLGRISVNQGDVEMFGNRYAIARADISFYNPSKIEPVLNLEVETKARGITVAISVSGTPQKLNISYRSDPPLESSDIVALLTVGRTPTTTAGSAINQTSTLLANGGGLLQQAISAPATNRLGRFFGISHLKIDPQFTGLSNAPQARLTLEQQVSKDITLTYITNLAQAQQQIVRVEWNVNRQWSVLALRDDNGAFGVDFQYRKRFK